MLVGLEPRDACAAPRELDRVEAGVAADVERGPAAKVGRKVWLDLAPFERREVAERMVGRGLPAIREMQILEPGRQRADLGIVRRCRLQRQACTSSRTRATCCSSSRARWPGVCDASTRSRARWPTAASPCRRCRSTSSVSSAMRISCPGSKNASRPAHQSEMTGSPHAAASKSRTLGDQPACTISARVTLRVKRWRA
jgi:hypothetical protein